MSNRASISRAITERATANPERAALTFAGHTVVREELDRATNRLARAYREVADIEGRLVSVALPNGIEFFQACIAIWKCGGTPHLVPAQMPTTEKDRLIQLADPALLVGQLPTSALPRIESNFKFSYHISDDALPDVVAPAWKALCSGGTTGKPKIIVDQSPGIVDLNDRVAGILPDLTQVVCGPLHHNMAFFWAARGLHVGHHLVILPKFDPEEVLRSVELHRAELIVMTPTMMQRIWNLGEDTRDHYDISSLKYIVHTAARCPEWLKRAYIDWLGPKRIWETYSGTERIASTAIRGDEWLNHPGSVGRVSYGRVRVLDSEGRDVPYGTVGEIYMQSGRDVDPYSYIGGEPRTRGAWESIGDLGRLDEDGYLYIDDRRTDLIIRGGTNIYPAEVESALERHSRVEECVVCGVPDEDLGERVHAVIRCGDGLNEEDLRKFAETQLAKYKLPTSYQFTSQTLRDEAGKVRRSAFKEAASE